MTDVSIRWLLDVVDRGQMAKLLAQDRQLRSSLQQTDAQYSRTASTATSAASTQLRASAEVAAGNTRQARAQSESTAALSRFQAAQRTAIAMGSRLRAETLAQSGALSRLAGSARAVAAEQARVERQGRVTSTQTSVGVRYTNDYAAALDRQAAAANRAAGAESRLARARRDAQALAAHASKAAKAGSGAAQSAGAATASAVGGGLTLARNVALGVGGAGVGLTLLGVKRASGLASQAAGISGLTGMSPAQATQLAIIAQAVGANARTLGQSFGTLGKQVIGYERAVAKEQAAATKAAAKGKPPPTTAPNATVEAFQRIGISQAQVKQLQNNLPALFDRVFKGAQKLPAAQQAGVIKQLLGRGGAFAGQLEAGGTLTQQLGFVGKETRGLDPKKLEELHVTELRLKETTDAIELSFAQAFGPPLISLFSKLVPVIPKVGELLRSGLQVPIEWLKHNAPSAIHQLLIGLGGGATSKPKPGQITAQPLASGLPGGLAQSETIGQEPTWLEKAGTWIRDAGKAAKNYGRELLAAVRPALPILKPLVEGFGKGLVAAFKIALPIIRLTAGALGLLAKALPTPVLHAFGLALGILAAGPLLRALGTIPRLGIVFRALALPIRAAQLALRGWIGVARLAVDGIGKIPSAVEKVRSVGGRLASGIAGAGSKVAGAARGLASKAVSGLSGLSGLVSRAASAGAGVARGLAGAAGKVAGAAGDLVSAAVGGLAGLAGRLVAAATAAGEALTATMATIGAAAGTALQTALVAGAGAAVAAAGFFIGKWLGENVHVSVDTTPPFIHIHIGGGTPVASAGNEAKRSRQLEARRGPNERDFSYLEHKRRGGLIRRFAEGGLVPAMLSPGEQVVYGGASMFVPGSPAAADTVPMMLPTGAAVLTHSGQAMVGAGASLAQAIAQQAPHFQSGGFVATAYGPPWGGIEGGGVTATGIDLSKSPHIYIVAVDPSVVPLHSKLRINPNPFNTTSTFGAEDTGGAIKGNRIDFYDWRGRQSQNAWGVRHVQVSRTGKSSATQAVQGAEGSTTFRVPVVLGASHTREGLVSDALSQGIEQGAAGVTTSEIAAATRGVRGARGYDRVTSLAEAIGEVTKEVTTSSGAKRGTTPAGSMAKGLADPNSTWNPMHKQLAKWIVPYLSFGSKHGWRGVLSSGYRSASEQRALGSQGARPVAAPGHSFHQGTEYPSGAVDVTEAASLAGALKKMKGAHLLVWAPESGVPGGGSDPVHFSHPHGGAFRRGGIVGLGQTPREVSGFKSVVHAAWESLQARGVLAGPAHKPSIYITSADEGWHTRAGALPGTLFFPGNDVYAVMHPHDEGITTYRNSALQAIVHEIAHTMQKPSVLKNVALREGGAQAWADEQAPLTFGAGYYNVGDSNYAGYVAAVKKRGRDWINHKQFIPGFSGGGIVGRAARFAKGGVVSLARRTAGQPFGELLPRLIGTAGTGAFEGVAARMMVLLSGFTGTYLNRLRAALVAEARKGGTAAVVKSMQAVISQIDETLGVRIGNRQRTIELLGKQADRATNALDRGLRREGIDASSAAGLGRSLGVDEGMVLTRRHQVVEAERGLREVRATGSQDKIAEWDDRLVEAQENLDDAIVKGIEDRRQLAITAAQEITDAAQAGVQHAQSQITGLLAGQRASHTQETVGALRQHAGAIESTLIPTLRAQLGAENSQLGVLQANQASAADIRGVLQSIDTAGNEIADAIAEASELIRTANEQAYQETVDRATHRTSLAQLGEQRLELEQRIKGTYDTGGAQRASYITDTLEPALRSELAALEKQQNDAKEQGDIKLAEQIGESVASKQNDILQANLDATEQIANNTERKPGGTLGFGYGQENLTDTLISVGAGA